MGRGDQARGHQVRVARRTFLAAGLDPYCGHGERPRSAERAETARSGTTFEERSGQADPRQGGAGGFVRRSTPVWRTFSIPRSARAAPAWGGADRPRQQAPRTPPLARAEEKRVQARAAAGQFLRSPRRFLQRPPGAGVGGARLRRSAAAELYRQNARAGGTRPRSGAKPRHRGAGRGTACRSRHFAHAAAAVDHAGARRHQFLRQRRQPAIARPLAARRPRRISRHAVDAAPPAAAGQVRRRPPLRHQIRFRTEGRPADRRRRPGRRRAPQ